MCVCLCVCVCSFMFYCMFVYCMVAFMGQAAWNKHDDDDDDDDDDDKESVLVEYAPAWTVDPVVDWVERNDRLGCFVDRLDRLRRLVDDFATRLDLGDLRPCWSQLSARACLMSSDAPCFRPTGWAWQWLTCLMPMPTINRKWPWHCH